MILLILLPLLVLLILLPLTVTRRTDEVDAHVRGSCCRGITAPSPALFLLLLLILHLWL